MKLTDQQIQELYNSITRFEDPTAYNSEDENGRFMRWMLPKFFIHTSESDGGPICHRIDACNSGGLNFPTIKECRAIIRYCERIIDIGDEGMFQVEQAIEEESARRRNAKISRIEHEQREGKKKNDSPGYVYVVRFGDHYKIGKTINITSRMSTYITENPNDPEDIRHWEVERYSEAESFLHEHFQEKRIKRKEWFSLNDEDIAMIPVLLKDYLVNQTA